MERRWRTNNETDELSPGQGKVLFGHLTCPQKFRLFTKAEGAKGHCEGMALGQPPNRCQDAIDGVTHGSGCWAKERASESSRRRPARK